MKRIIAVLMLVTVLCFSFASCTGSNLQSLSGNTEITCKIENSEAIVTGIPNKSTVISVVIPDEYEGIPITKIADFAGVNLEYVLNIKIGKNVKEISDWAFGNSKKIIEFEVDENNPYICDIDGVVFTKDMKTLLFYPPAGCVQTEKDKDGNEVKSISYEIPEGVETIRSKAFYKCYELTEIKLPSSLKHIEEKAFFRCSLKSLTLPEGIETIGKDAFAFNSAIEKLTVPASVKQIDEYAFFSCTSMLEVNMKGKESEMTLGKKWYPTKNGDELRNPPLVINWENK